MHKTPYLLVLFVLIAPLVAKADDQQAQSAEAKMRQVLRDTMMQLRDAQNQVVTLQAAKDQGDKDKTELEAKVETLSTQLKTAIDQSIADKAAADKSIDELKSQVTDQKGQIDRLAESLKQWKDAYGQVSQLATAKEAARAQLAIQAAVLKRTVDDRETKNLELFSLGKEILARYERFGLGDALAAKEPFVGLSRVKLETLVQDYKNKLLDQAITTNSGSSSVKSTSEHDALPEKAKPSHPADNLVSAPASGQ